MIAQLVHNGNVVSEAGGARGAKAVHVVALSAFVLISCERPMPQETDFRPAAGYQINGRIEDRFGVAMQGVEIYPYYVLTYVSSDTAPERKYEVRDSTTYVTMRVLNSRDSVVRELGAGWFTPGFLLAEWDRKDETGGDVSSGVYRVCYVVGGAIAWSYPVLVEGTVTARSDSSGAFTLWDHHLPIGFEPVPYYSWDSTVFYGTYSVGGTVLLDLVTPSKIHTIAIRPTKDRVTNVPVVLQ